MRNSKKKKFLFFFVHPSKYYLFRNTVNYLKKNGHQTEIIIIKKDVLEDLVKQEGWEYTNIFPEGRRSKSQNSLLISLTTAINFFKTVYRLFRYCKHKKFDLFITDDCLAIIGWIKRKKVIMFSDDDLSVVPSMAILYFFSSKIVAPESTDLGMFNKKKIPLRGYKELAFLHPDYFTPNREVVEAFNAGLKKYVIIRLVSLTASHDARKKGLRDDDILRIIDCLNDDYKIFISSERPLPRNLENKRLQIKPEMISHVIYYSELLISDSQTMTSEAAVLGVPSVRFNDFVGKISSMEEKEIKYGLTYGFKTNNFEAMLSKIKELIQMPELKKEWQNRRMKMLENTVDVNHFMSNLLENFN